MAQYKLLQKNKKSIKIKINLHFFLYLNLS